MRSEYDQGYADGMDAMRALLATEQSTVQFGPIAYNRTIDCVFIHDKLVRLPPSYRRIIEVLITGRTIRHETLAEVLWPMGDEGVDTCNVTKVHISKLRRRLIEYGAGPSFILTVWGIGYRLNPDDDCSRTIPTACLLSSDGKQAFGIDS